MIVARRHLQVYPIWTKRIPKSRKELSLKGSRRPKTKALLALGRWQQMETPSLGHLDSGVGPHSLKDFNGQGATSGLEKVKG